MKKRSKYRPKPVLQDPLNWVLTGMKKVNTANDVMVTARIMNHGAIEAIRTGKANWEDVSVLVIAINLAVVLAELGLGKDWLSELKEGMDAMNAIKQRNEWVAKGPELTVITTALAIHDAQLDECIVSTLEEAMRIVRKIINIGEEKWLNRGPIG